MKLALGLLCLSLTTSAFAQDEGNTRATRVKARDQSSDELVKALNKGRRQLQGKGSSKGSKGGCTTFNLFYRNDDFKESFDGNNLVGTNEVDLYDSDTGEIVGVYQESTIAIGQRDCYSTGIYSFFPFDNNDRPRTQVFISSTCQSRNQAVIGGTGKFFCSTGFVKLENKGNNNNKFRTLKVCPNSNQCES